MRNKNSLFQMTKLHTKYRNSIFPPVKIQMRNINAVFQMTKPLKNDPNLDLLLAMTQTINQNSVFLTNCQMDRHSEKRKQNYSKRFSIQDWMNRSWSRRFRTVRIAKIFFITGWEKKRKNEERVENKFGFTKKRNLWRNLQRI